MAQVSGSVALDFSKIERNIVRGTVDELTRTDPTELERDNGVPVPLAVLADAVAERVMVRLDHDLGGVLAEVRTGLARMEELFRAESARRDRMMVRPDMATGEFRAVREPLVVNGPDGQPLYEVDPAALVERGQGPAWDPGQEPVWPGHDQPTNPGIDADDVSGQVDR